MPRRKWIAPWGLLLLSGCLYHATERTDLRVGDMAAQPYDIGPTTSAESAPTPKTPSPLAPLPPGERGRGQGAALPAALDRDVQTAAFLQVDRKDDDIQTADFFQKDEKEQPGVKPEALPTVPQRAPIPPRVPGAETAPIQLPPKDRAKQLEYIHQLYPKLPPVPEEPKALPGPESRPYTLSDFQRIAAENSPTLRQAAADVEVARGNLIQAQTYPNPTVSVEFQPSSNGVTPGFDGVAIDQPIKTAGKMKLQTAAAEKALEVSEFALKRARCDLATQVRNAYFALLVNLETVRVTKAMAVFTDEIYRWQADQLEHTFSAAYEPAALRAQAYTVRLALKSAIVNYCYSWKQLVAVIGLPQLPLTEVAGRVDRAIPYYDYDAVLAYALRNHTDVLTAHSTVEQAKYNLKLAQVMPIPDVDVNIGVLHDFAVAPFGTTPTMQVSIPLPVWDRNKGGIMAAEASLVRATEEPHRVSVNLTNSLATAYANYKNNLDALEYYRKFILPDQVRTYRGVYERRRVDPNSAWNDLVTAQQALVSNVTTYLGILGSLWSSVTSVADFLQTDDLFQLGQPLPLPPLPDLEPPHWMCPHPTLPSMAGCPTAAVPVPTKEAGEMLPAPKVEETK